MQQFEADGISFTYPNDWRLEREDSDDGWTTTVYGPGTAFGLFRLDRTLPDPREVVETVLAAMKADYPHLDARQALDMLAGEMALGHDIEFFTLDLSNTAWTRSFYATAGTLLVLCQVTDQEQEVAEPLLRAMCQSLRVEVD